MPEYRPLTTAQFVFRLRLLGWSMLVASVVIGVMLGFVIWRVLR